MSRKQMRIGRLGEHQAQLVKLIESMQPRHRKHEIFSDFVELASLSISNAVDRGQYDAREARYMQIAKGYTREEMDKFCQMLAHLTMAFEGDRFHDALGRLFMAMEMGDHWRGQFFTPYEVSYAMAQMTVHDMDSHIREKGFFTMNEPACGAGGMVIAVANALMDKEINYQQAMHVTAQDIDITAVHMTYLQLSLLHIPAVVIHGNSLWPDKEQGYWFTPAHVLGGWSRKLRQRDRAEPREVGRLAA